MRKFVLDTNCFVDASRRDDDAAALAEFCARAAPGLYSVPSSQPSFEPALQATATGARWSATCWRRIKGAGVC